MKSVSSIPLVMDIFFPHKALFFVSKGHMKMRGLKFTEGCLFL